MQVIPNLALFATNNITPILTCNLLIIGKLVKNNKNEAFFLKI